MSLGGLSCVLECAYRGLTSRDFVGISFLVLLKYWSCDGLRSVKILLWISSGFILSPKTSSFVLVFVSSPVVLITLLS